MSAPPLFSIITVTLNNYDGVRKTHQSVTTQTFQNYEWVIIDGASTDNTVTYLNSLNIDHISDSDSGLYDAMNKGIDRAQGNYLIFMNAGDIFASIETLQTLADTLDKKNPDFAYGDALEIFNNREVYKKTSRHWSIIKGMFTHHQAMVYKRSALGTLRYDLQYKIAADYDFTYRFLNKTDHVKYIPTPLCLFESGGVSQTQALKGRVEQFKIRQNLDIKVIKNISIFVEQTLTSAVRQICPRLYWWLKALQTRL